MFFFFNDAGTTEIYALSLRDARPICKRSLAGDTAREATSEEVKGLRRQAGELKEVVAELMLENRLLKKSMTGYGDDEG